MRNHKRSSCKLSGRAVTAFFISLLLCSFLTGVIIKNRTHIEKLQMDRFILEKNYLINEVITKQLYKTKALAALVILGDGRIDNFDVIAPTLIEANDAAILNLIIAPDGIVSNVYPLEGNENVIGLDLFGDREGSKEAIAARDSGELVLGGPFNMIEGSQALVGRLPVFIDTPDGEKIFWGIVSVALRFPDILEYTNLDIFKIPHFSYELWRTNPETNEKQVIISGGETMKPYLPYVEREVEILNAKWFLRVSPVRPWYNYTENIIFIISALFISFLIFFIMQNNFKLRQMKKSLEFIALHDPLTGIYNRRYMEDNLNRLIKTLSRSGGSLSLLMLDVDFFKKYNDTYGHNQGDVCLKTIATVIYNSLSRADDFVARFGGEEFVIILPNTDENGARKIASDLLKNVRDCNMPHGTSDIAGYVTVSIGGTTGNVEYTQNGEDFIKQADKMLYAAKQGGRDRFVFENM